MSSTEQHARIPSHRGTFAEGEAMPDQYAGEDRIGSFADGQQR